MKEIFKIICLQCGKEFLVKRHRKDIAKFCSWKCFCKYKGYSGEKINITCKQCGKKFIVDRKRKNTAKFCSKNCFGKFDTKTRRKRKRVNIICQQCGKEFEVQQYLINQRKFCSIQCASKNKIGKEHLNKKSKIIIFCQQCGKKFEVKHYRKNKAYFCSYKCYWESLIGTKQSEEQKKKKQGSNNCNWKGGTRKIHNRLHDRCEYKEWRLSVFKRDNFTCQMPDCDGEEKYLHAHHIIKKSNILDNNNIKTLEEAINCKELWDINNGITLCKKCHNKIRNSEEKYIPIFQTIINSKQVYAYTNKK